MTSVPARNVLAGLPAGQAAKLLRRVSRGGDENAGVAELAAEESEDRMLPLATACGEVPPVHRRRGPARATA